MIFGPLIYPIIVAGFMNVIHATMTGQLVIALFVLSSLYLAMYFDLMLALGRIVEVA